MSGLREFIRSLLFRPPVRGEAIPEPEALLEVTMDELAETMRNSMKIDLDLEHVESKGAQSDEATSDYGGSVMTSVSARSDAAILTSNTADSVPAFQLQVQSPTLYLQGCDLFNPEVVPVVEEQMREDQADVIQAPEIQQNQRYLATSYRNRSNWTASHGTGASDFETCLKMFNDMRGDLQLAIGARATSSNQINEELERFDEMCDTLLRAKFEKGIPQAGNSA
ncbi:unnamed protein product, partial [Mesorhabditis spiculigera]